jgi:hypothetical protein
MNINQNPPSIPPLLRGELKGGFRRIEYMKDNLFQKSFTLKAATGAEVTPEILARINSFALKPLTEEMKFLKEFLLV